MGLVQEKLPLQAAIYIEGACENWEKGEKVRGLFLS